MKRGTYNKVSNRVFDIITVVLTEVKSEDPDGRAFFIKQIYLTKESRFLKHRAGRILVNYNKNNTEINLINLLETRKRIIDKLKVVSVCL